MLLFIVFSAIIVVVENRENTLTGPQREIILNEHNKLRSRLAFGTIKNRDDIYMPTAKNMLEVIWNKKLDTIAQGLASADAKHTLIAHTVGMNVFRYRSFGEDNIENFIIHAISASLGNWTSELNYRYENNPENKYTSDIIKQRASSFAQMAWGKTHEIGCGIAVNMERFGRSAVFVCLYKPCGKKKNELIYELGAPCKDDSDCDDGKCLKESGLCRKKKQNQLISLFRILCSCQQSVEGDH
ncbi:Cysteine-rich secretory family protein [Acanthocheilonema viteae]